MERRVSLREACLLSCGDISTRSRNHSLKVTWLDGLVITWATAPRRVGLTPPSGPWKQFWRSTPVLCRRNRQPPTSCFAKGPTPTLKVGPAEPYSPATSEYCALRGVPSLSLCLRCFYRYLPRTAHWHAGQPSRCTVPVHLSTSRSRPPACHRRGRSPSILSRATAPMVRRSGASEPEATQKAVAPGRRDSRARRVRPH